MTCASLAANDGGMSLKDCRIHQDVIKVMSDTSLKSSKEGAVSNSTHICEDFELQLWCTEHRTRQEKKRHSDKADKHDAAECLIGGQ